MKSAALLRFALTGFLCWTSISQVTKAQKPTVVVKDWNAELAKAKAAIEKNPKSAFWHNQAGVAYNALGDFKSAVREIKLAITLDTSDPINYYTLYAVYQTQGMHAEEHQALLDALERDDNNALGHFQLGHVLEEEKYWWASLREYQTAKRLAASVTGPVYTDRRGNAYALFDQAQVDNAIERVAKLNESEVQHKK
jgi:tetratricopeptide (TPR) repeat protein